MSKTILKVVVWFCIVTGAFVGVYAGYSVVPFSDDIGPLFSYVVLGTIFGCIIGGGLGATFVYVVTAEGTIRRKRIVLVLVVGLGVSLLLVYVFRREPVECDQIQENELRTFLKSDSANITQVKQLLTKFPLEENKIEGLDYGDGIKVLTWRTKDAEYSIHFRNDLLTKVYVTWDLGRLAGLKPTVEEVIACFGSPDLYEATYFVEVLYLNNADKSEWSKVADLSTISAHFELILVQKP